jgi:predicted permease
VFATWRELPALEAVEGFDTGTALIESEAGLSARESAWVSPGLLEMLGARALRGRLFSPDEGHAGTDEGVIIAEPLWRSGFGADASVIGRRVTIDGRSRVVIGVLPASFRFPTWSTAVWLPNDFLAPPPGQAARLPQAIVRRSAGLPEADALRLATTAAHEADPETAKLKAVPTTLAGPRANDYLVRAAPLLAGGVVLVFLILCANVSSLLLGRLTARSRQFSIATALGASRARLLRGAFVEAALLGAVGVGAGLALAVGLVQIARSFLPEAMLRQTLNPVTIDLAAVAVASAAGLVATLAAGLLPAWLGTRATPGLALRGADRGSSETRASRSATRVLLVGEIALACTLLAGAVLLVRSFVNLTHANRGLDTRGVLAVWVDGLPGTAPDRESRLLAAQAIGDTMRAIPAVRQVAFSFGAPPGGGGVSFGDDWLSDLPGASPQKLTVERYSVGASFFELYGISILRGRTFEQGDANSEVIVGERFAALLWPALDPVGRSFRFGKEAFRVIGLAREIHLPAIDPRSDRPEFYEPFSGGGTRFTMSIRCNDACPDAAVIRSRILEASPGARVWRVDVLEDAYLEQSARPRAAAALGLVFATIAVLAAAGGLFAVLSYAVSRRRREFGIRLALGAKPADVRHLVFGDGLRIALAGLAIGGVASWWLARAIASMTYGVSAGDASIWFTVAGVVAITTLLASWRPASRAGRVDPVTLLRED